MDWSPGASPIQVKEVSFNISSDSPVRGIGAPGVDAGLSMRQIKTKMSQILERLDKSRFWTGQKIREKPYRIKQVFLKIKQVELYLESTSDKQKMAKLIVADTFKFIMVAKSQRQWQACQDNGLWRSS